MVGIGDRFFRQTCGDAQQYQATLPYVLTIGTNGPKLESAAAGGTDLAFKKSKQIKRRRIHSEQLTMPARSSRIKSLAASPQMKSILSEVLRPGHSCCTTPFFRQSTSDRILLIVGSLVRDSILEDVSREFKRARPCYGSPSIRPCGWLSATTTLKLSGQRSRALSLEAPNRTSGER